MDALWSILVWVILIGIIVAVIYFRRQQALANRAAVVLATLDLPGCTALRLTQTELMEVYGDAANRHPVAGLTATVEQGGNLNRRFTVTRIVALGVLAAGVPKKNDDRELYLTIEGPTTVIVHAIP